MAGDGLTVLANLPFAAGVGSALVALHLLSAGAGPRGWPNRFLGGFFLLFACQLFVLSYQLDSPGAHAGPVRVALILAANPLVFLFFRSLRSGGAYAWRPIDTAHFLPVLLVPALSGAGYGGGLDVALFASMAGYGAAYLLALRSGPEQFPVAAGRAFRWLQVFAVFYPFSAFLDAAIALELLGDADLGNSQLLPVAVLLVFGVSLVLVFGAMGRRPPFDWLRELAAAKSRPVVSDRVLDELAARIRSAIARERVYGDEEISLTRFARQIGEPPRLVSQAINRRLGMSFSDLLNTVRVDAARRLLADPERRDRPVIDIAYAVGFRSKSNFHRAFKQRTGMTPNAFRAGSHTQ
ncbi:MAG: helix-turn-helix transcriptional regulator [Proteobacteria bacterium]|nr:helix-turn-helix transcriptional regulator [Pseudomonadota bacterium]